MPSKKYHSYFQPSKNSILYYIYLLNVLTKFGLLDEMTSIIPNRNVSNKGKTGFPEHFSVCPKRKITLYLYVPVACQASRRGQQPSGDFVGYVSQVEKAS